MDARSQVSSEVWLKSHGLKKKKLTLPKILAQLGFQQREEYINKLGRPVSSRYSNGLFQQYNSNGKIYNLTAKKEDVLQKVDAVLKAERLYNERLEWLQTSSRPVFGVIQEQSIVIIIDLGIVSKIQYDLCRDAICLAIREQVAHIFKFNLIWVSQEPVKWHHKVIPVIQQSIQQAVEWIWNIQHSPVVNVESAAEAVAEALDDQVDAVYYFCAGDVPMRKIKHLLTSIENSPCPLHVVCYNPHKTEMMMMLKELSHRTSGRFHVYSDKEDTMPTQGNRNEEMPKRATEKDLLEFDHKKDKKLIDMELGEAQEVLKQLQDIIRSLYPSDDDTNNYEESEETTEDCVSSSEWLKQFGLKPQKLLFYDALAGCAFRHSDGIVDIKIKPEDESVQTDAENNMKLINAKYCDQFVHIIWKDGLVVHVHISKEKYRWYEEKMKAALDRMERRVKWLQKGSRELFGTILEDRIYILIDTSHSMKDKLFLVKEKIFQLMQEQLKHKKMFNFVKFDSKVEAWKSKLAEVNEENLKEATYWVKELQVGGSTNTLKALQVGLSDINTQAVYLLTDGRPDQPSETIFDNISLFRCIPIHTISFNCDDTEANTFMYELSKKTGGRFHSYTSNLSDPDAPQPFVSKDIQLLLNEIEEGRSSLERIKKLHIECLMLDWYRNGAKDPTHRLLETQSLNSFSRLHSAQESKMSSPLLQRESLSPSRISRRKKVRHAENTKSSVLRALSHGVKTYQSKAGLDTSFEMNNLLLIKDFKDLKKAESDNTKDKTKRLPKNDLDMSSSRWLRTHGLIARRLTIMDALAPTTVPHSAKYIPVLDKHVVSKVFDEVFPLAHVNEDKKMITLINPQAVNLAGYKEKLQRAIITYERRLNLVVWRALSQEERDRFDSDVPISYFDYQEALLQALDRLGWPISAEDIMLLEDEIAAGKTYLQQATDLQEASKNHTKVHQDPMELIWISREVAPRSGTDKGFFAMIGLDPEPDVQSSPITGHDLSGVEDQYNLSEKPSASVKDNDPSGSCLVIVFQSVDFGSSSYMSLGVTSIILCSVFQGHSFSRLEYDYVKNEKPISTSSKEDHDMQRNERKPKRKHLDALRGQKVIARSEVDGFYYQGTVIRSINSKCALVDFMQGENQIVPITFLIQTGGALPWPNLKVGDFVFSKTGAKGGNCSCFVPAVVIATPRREAEDKLYTVLKYNNRKEHCLRSELFKISASHFTVSCRYIRKAQMIDYTIPSVQLVKPLRKPSPPKEESRSGESRQSLNLHTRSRTPSDYNSDSSSGSALKDINLPSESINRKLEDLAWQVTEHQKEQKENQKTVQQFLTDLTKLNSHRGKVEEEQKDLTKQHIDLLEQLKTLLPISGRKQEKDVKQDANDVQPLIPGQKVLSVCPHNGWYEDGSIIHDCGDLTYFVQSTSGEIARIPREEILSDTDDYTKEIKEGDFVIGPHPLHPGRYCPGVVLRCTAHLKAEIKYYNDTNNVVPREHVYLISAEKYERDTAHILACEQRWVGQPVVARNDETGTFHLAEVLKRADDGNLYIITWSDGKTTVQGIEWIFGKFSPPHSLAVGDYVLTLADPATMTFLPGVITDVNGEKLQIHFADENRCHNVESHHCFGLSEKKYNSALQFYLQHKPTKDEAEHYISSDSEDNEDSLTDISSFTVSSVNNKASR
ncbi:von Willebrand factor A domain-containing protein 3B [Gastrophryne carolinensis]